MIVITDKTKYIVVQRWAQEVYQSIHLPALMGVWLLPSFPGPYTTLHWQP